MHKVSHNDFSCIVNILDAIEKIQKYTQDIKNADEFYTNTIVFDATMMNFIVIGEMATKLSENSLKETESKIEWFKIKGFRNIIAHNYFGIDAEDVWQIINRNLPELKGALEVYLNHVRTRAVAGGNLL